jgi:hypothetical protein
VSFVASFVAFFVASYIRVLSIKYQPLSPQENATGFIDPRYEWSITFLSQFSNFAKTAFNWLKKSAKLAANWLETKPRVVSYGRIHMTNFKIL